jgi:hypothetical protein
MAKRDIPTEECVAAVEVVLTSAGDEEGIKPFGLLRLVPSPSGEHKTVTPDPELKVMLDEMRRRISANSDRGGLDTGGKDAA